MKAPLIFDINHPKWSIVLKILQIMSSAHARKIAKRLEIYDANNFLLLIKLLELADLFEMNLSSLISEINYSDDLKKILGLKSELKNNISTN